MMKPLIGILLLTLLAACRSTDDRDIVLLTTLRNASNDAIARHDTTGIASFWTADVHLISSRNTEVSGKQAQRHLFAMDFASKQQLRYIRTPESFSVFRDWGMASESGKWTGSWEEPDGKVVVSGTYYAKWHLVGDEWKIRAEVFVPLSCQGGRFCENKPSL
jgi:ketosteroid isomerase-like protein